MMRNLLLSFKKIGLGLVLLMVMLVMSGNAFGQITTLSVWSNVYNGTGDYSGSLTLATGTNANRVLVVGIATSTRTASARTVTLTYGGQSLTPVNGNLGEEVRQHTQLYYLNEAGIDAAIGSTLSFSVSGGATAINSIFTGLYDNIDQNSPITDSKIYSSGTGTTTTFQFATGLSINANNLALKVLSSVRVGSTTPRTISNFGSNWTVASQPTGNYNASGSTNDLGIRNAVGQRSIPTTNTTDVSSTSMSNATLISMTGLSLKSAGPSLSVTPISYGFGDVCLNSTVGPQNFTISGAYLTAVNVTVSSLTGYTFSTTSGGTYTPSLSLTQAGGSYSQEIFVKFSPTTATNYDGNITIGGGGANSVDVTVTGSGINTAPSISNPTSANITESSADLGGDITSFGCSQVTERGIYWSTTNGFADGTGTKVSETGTFSAGNFSVPVLGLNPNTTYYFKAFATNGGGTVYTGQGTFTTGCLALGDPAIFGNNEWKVYGYNGKSIDLSGTTYRGFYTVTGLDFDTRNSWTNMMSPSSVVGYQGCTVNVDNMTFVHKRRGFPCGIYQISVGHDDDARLYVNGTQVWAETNWNNAPVIAGSFFLDETSTVELRVQDGNGASYGQLVFAFTSAVTAAPIISSPICPGSTSVNGSEAAANGTVIELFKNGISVGTTTVSSNTWSKNGLSSVNEGDVFTATGIESGKCISDISSPVTVPILPGTPTAGNNGPICEGSTLNLTTSLVSGATYSWTGPNGFTSNLQNPSITNATTLASGLYSVTVTVGGCTSNAGTTSATVNSVPSAPIAGNNGPICEGLTLNLTASLVSGATYSWTGPNGFISNQQNPSISNATTLASGLYSVTAAVNGCTSSVGTTLVMVNSIPSAPSIGTVVQPTCDVATGSATLNGLPSGTWTLTMNPGGVKTTGTGSSTTITNLAPGTYSFTVSGEDESTACPGSGNGLKGEYFNVMDFSGTPVLTRTDATVNFNWGTGTPGSPVNSNNFSVRWSGKIQACYTENYTFTTRSDDGIRLWVNGSQIINNWTDHSATNNSGNVSLVAGQKYDIVLEFYENGGDAVSQLSWSCPSEPTSVIIPQSQLYSEATGCTSVASANVVINSQPSVPAAPTSVTPSSATSVCSGETIDLNATSAGNTIYWFTQASGGTTIGSSNSGENFSVSPVANTTYYAEAQTPSGCISATRKASGLITVTANLSAVALSPASQQNICTDGSGSQITVTETNGGTISARQWGKRSVSGGAITAISGATGATYTPTGADLGVGTWYLVCTSTPTCGSAMASNEITVVVSESIGGTVSGGVTPACLGSSTGTLTLTGFTGTIKNWERRLDGGSWTYITNSSATYSEIPSSAGTWQYRAVVQNGSCNVANSSEISIVVDPVSVGGGVYDGTTPICLNSWTGTMNLRAGYVGNVVRWEKRVDGGAWSNIANTSTTYSENPSVPGTWEYRALVQSGSCTAVYSAAFSVVVNPELTISLGVNPEVCQTVTTTSIPYSATTGSPEGWVLTFNAAAISAKFSSPQNGSLASAPGNIPVNVPYDAEAGVYQANLKLIKYTPSCSSVDYPVTITVSASQPASVTIAASSNPVCSGTSVTYTATPTNGGTTPTYQWKVNGSNVGTNSAIYSYIPVNGDVVDCILTSSATCASGSPATSNSVTMTVNAELPVSINIAASSNPICSGTSVTYTATPTNGGTTPTYQWKVNGSNVGTNSATYSYTPVNGDVVTCVLISSETCASGSPATSNSVTMTVNAELPVSISIATNTNPVCAGSGVTFTATPVNGGDTPEFQWKVNNNDVGTNSATYSYIPGNGDVVSCRLTSDVNCATGNPAASNTITMTVNPIPALTNSPTKTICNGSSTNITLTATTASSYSWTIGTIAGGITGASAGEGSSIDQVLTNPSNSSAGSVQYIVTPTSLSGTCVGSPFTITATVQSINALVSDISDEVGSDCPDFGDFNPNTASYNPGYSVVKFRVERDLSGSAWNFDYNLTGGVVYSGSPEVASATKSIAVGTDSVDMVFYVANTPGAAQNIVFKVVNVSDSNCSNNGINRTVTHTISAMPAIGSFN